MTRADELLTTLLEVEHAGWRALCAQRGGAHYGTLMTPDGLMILVDGSILDRDAVVASLDDAPPWDDYALAEPRALDLGRDVAALAYRAEATRAGQEPFRAQMTSTYRFLDGVPRLVLYQQTATP
ncbi:hypothetical protein GCM10027060_20280 [Nesterenkonia halophila]|uniref:nuclear transport factor 2 family protein n=1 Tax=Nesterenkonia halophila TaxID=302044 RepID=UPI00129255A1|nr:nuclear transport factor 2 family protein [Nesterenkonia halophila]